ncbi:hypothetical protein LEP1GSC058_1913 [Leptospira fainei serovar Hurstbridge str. BUT 6]|uniref:Uncharacterized protein n=1 Tax=Leptospira fainei serovar Hurstbridge str. BUT 6 TaxID=1193011 RepID=S3UYW2_9LEPT|nr:hypothetical protein [Leptospira fainei]EPG75606.1 hypothetical protein LEP1GSC058_1913 [Leptospira fainei serovar Hurstbridge str. BUT 6]
MHNSVALEDYQRKRKNPVASPYLEQAQQALTIVKFDPGRYEAVETFFLTDWE